MSNTLTMGVVAELGSDPKVEKALRILREQYAKYGSKMAVACSFGKDSMVVVHLALKVDPHFPVFCITTRYKPRETFEYKETMTKLWRLNIKEYRNDNPQPERLYETDPDECCRQLKVLPAREAVRGLEAWACGLRNTEGRTRKDFQDIEVRDGLVKVNPILEWTEADVWRYLAVNQVPVHPWYGFGYRSLGCAPCTKPGGEYERDGRWQGTSKCGGECGIHTQSLRT